MCVIVHAYIVRTTICVSLAVHGGIEGFRPGFRVEVVLDCDIFYTQVT